uniref:Transport permease protein n=1 Tax=uncultured bacterium BAC-AB1442/1414/561 TaxID=1562172 RepID=A0A0C4S6F4_9BACT|nr:ABC transporter [uncultured bacterium BAC-AB1442/1414/561]
MTTISAVESRVDTSTWQGTNIIIQVLVLTGRSLRALIRNPQLLMISLAQPVVFLVLLTQVFSSLASADNFPAGITYVDFLMPAFIAVSGLSAASEAGVGLTTDMRSGVLTRFRSLPVSNIAVLFARSIAEVVRNILVITLLVVLAVLLFDFDPPGGFSGVLLAGLLSVAVSWGVVWIFLALGAWLRTAEGMQALGFIALFPLMFVSSMFVPVANLPGWLQAVAKVNPVTYVVDASRNLAFELPVGNSAVLALVASVALTAIGMTAAIIGFRRPL